MGLYHPQLDGTVRSRDLGVWINRVERQKAYEDNEFWSFGLRRRTKSAPRCLTRTRALTGRPASVQAVLPHAMFRAAPGGGNHVTEVDTINAYRRPGSYLNSLLTSLAVS